VRGGAGLRLLLIADGRVRLRRRLRHDDETVTTTLRSGDACYLRAELHGRPWFDLLRPLAGRLDIEALTNPVYLVEGPAPDPPPALPPSWALTAATSPSAD